MRQHVCDICGFTGPWTDRWAYSGSINDLEQKGIVLKVCSQKCRDKCDNPTLMLKCLQEVAER